MSHNGGHPMPGQPPSWLQEVIWGREKAEVLSEASGFPFPPTPATTPHPLTFTPAIVEPTEALSLSRSSWSTETEIELDLSSRTTTPRQAHPWAGKVGVTLSTPPTIALGLRLPREGEMRDSHHSGEFCTLYSLKKPPLVSHHSPP